MVESLVVDQVMGVRFPLSEANFILSDVAQHGQSDWLLTSWTQVRILSPEFVLVC